MKELLNGAKLPNWAYMLAAVAVIAFNGGVMWAVNSATLGNLVAAQDRTTKEVGALREEMRTNVVTRIEYTVLQQRVESNARRIDSLDDQMWAKGTLAR